MAKTFNVISPIDGEVVCTLPLASVEDVNKTVQKSHDAQKKWRNTPIRERIEYCRFASSSFFFLLPPTITTTI